MNRTFWRRILSLYRAYAAQQAGALVCVLVGVGLSLLPPLLFRRIIDVSLPAKDFREDVFLVLCLVAVALANTSIDVLHDYLTIRTGEAILRDIVTSLVSRLHHAPLSFFIGSKTGELMNRVSGDAAVLDDVVKETLSSVVANVTTMIATSAVILAIDWRLGIIALTLVAAPSIYLPVLRRRLAGLQLAIQHARDDFQSLTQQTLSSSGSQLLKSLGTAEYERRRVEAAANALMRSRMALAVTGQAFGAVVTSTLVFGPALIWAGGAWLVISGTMTVGTVVAFGAYASSLYGPAAALAGMSGRIAASAAAFERIFAYLDVETEDYARKGAIVIEPQGNVAWKNVTFSYEPGRDVVSEVSFSASAGQMVAIVGASGSGKSTVAKLMVRLWDPQSGTISLDGHDLRDLDLAMLRTKIAIVTQETALFHDTIAANLRYARPDATAAELEHVAQIAHLEQFIEDLPLGYETVVGDRGFALSGGQRQRIAIARALLQRPAILVMDEATSALDSETERSVLASVGQELSQKTWFVVSHRLSSVQNADLIVVLQNGRVCELGAHAGLLAAGGAYARMYEPPTSEGSTQMAAAAQR